MVVGDTLGTGVGLTVNAIVGFGVGDADGESVGMVEGETVGTGVGLTVGEIVGSRRRKNPSGSSNSVRALRLRPSLF
jgi:hypothetical protein